MAQAYIVREVGRRAYGIFTTLEKAKAVVDDLMLKDGYEEDDYHWHDAEDQSIAYSDKYMDQPENDMYKIVIVEMDVTFEGGNPFI